MLCVAVMLSVMVVGAGAAFSDQSKIKNTEAVDACVALNIIGGYGDNTYRPENNITRAEVCKMICVALNGGKEPTLSVPATPTFKDVRNDANSAWAEKYIESCVAQGIVGGVGNGMFQPSQNVTGSQLAKMLLVALGYKSEIEGFGGNGWDTQVNVVATQKGLYEDLETIDVSAALSRDSAAQMIWNALQAVEVEYEYTLDGTNGSLTSKADVVDKTKIENGSTIGITLLADKYGVIDNQSAIMTGASYDADKAEWTYTFTGGNLATTNTYKSTTDYTDLYQQNTKVVYKVSNGKTTVYGMYADGSSVLATGVLGDIDLVSSDNKKVEINDVEYKLSSANTAVNLVSFLYGTNASTLDKIATFATAEKQAWNFTLIDRTDDGKGDIIVIYPVSIAKVTYAGTKSISAGSEYKYEDHNIADGIEKDDYVVITADANTPKDGATIVKADIVSGKVTGQKANQVQVDGTWYKVAKMGTCLLYTSDAADEL